MRTTARVSDRTPLFAPGVDYRRGMTHRLPERDRPWMMRTYAGHSTAARSNELYRRNLAKGQTGLSVAFDLPTQTGLRRRPRARARRGRQGRCAGGAPWRHGGAAGRHPARRDEHVDDDQRDGGVAAGALHRRGRGAGRRRGRAVRDDPERHHQGVPLARDLRVPARAVDAADRGHGRLHGRARPALEPREHLLLPPAGGGGDAGAGDRVLDGDGVRRAGRGGRAGAGGAHARGVRADLVLRQRRRALRGRAREAAGDGRAVGGAGADRGTA